MSHLNEKAWSAERVLVHLPAIVLMAVAVPVPFDLGLLVLGCAAVLYRVGVQRAHRSIGLLDGLVILFGLSYLTASAFGSDPLRSLLLGYPVLMGMALYALHSRSDLSLRPHRASLISLAVLCVIFSVWVLVAAPLGTAPQQRVDAAQNLLFVVPNDALLLAFLAAMSLPLLQDERLAWRVLASVAWMLAFLVGFVLQSRGILLVLLVTAVGGILMAGRGQPRLALGLGAGVVLVLGMEIALHGPFSSKFIGWSDARIPLWQAAWAQFTEAPLLGHGPGSFGVLHDPGADPSVAVIDWRVSPWPHNLLLELLAGGGLLLAVAFVAIGGHALRLAIRIRAAKPVEGSAWLLGLLVLCAASLFEASLLRFWFTVSLFSLLGSLNAIECRHTVVSIDRTPDHGRSPGRNGHPPRHHGA